MEYSSESSLSFVWTDASSDSSMTSTQPMTKSSLKKEKVKSTSRNSSGDLDNSESSVKVKEEEEKSATMKHKIIKVEPESDYDVPKKKKKKKKHSINESQDEFHDTPVYDDSYLDMKVKKEDKVSSQKQNKKKRKHSCTTDIEPSSCDDTYLNMKVKEEENMCSSHKAKKKSKHSSVNDSDNTKYNPEDNMETKQQLLDEIVTKPKKKKKSKRRQDSETIKSSENVEEILENNSKNNEEHIHKGDVNKNNSFDNVNSESGGEEISVIKGDEDHNLHTNLFPNNTISSITEEDSINCNKSLLNNVPNEIAEKQGHRKPRISDRIRFEDDENISEVPTLNSDHCYNVDKYKKVIQYVKENVNLKQVTHKLHNEIALTTNDNIWILKCPKEIDVKAFKGVSFNTQGKCKVKVNGQTYEGSTSEEAPDSVVVLTMNNDKFAIRNLPLNGMISMRRRIPKPHFRDDNIMINNQTNFIPLPETKCRHPLFGSHYKKSMKIPKAVSERLNAQDSDLKTIEKVKKKQKKKNKLSTYIDEQVSESPAEIKSELDISLEVREKKKKKRKLDNDDDPVPRKIKKIKNDPDSAAAWESEKAIEQNLFNF